ncbi:MAG: 3-phosphoshikimate 1-carboxyvinyltransferase, partial [Elusimicrobia bacterium]|nr:3-phosphoshikimate 1-carboxyvinyltransferase [Elusimicrobiota bacterium]
FAQGPTVLKDIAHARAKESDRISDLRRELLKVGADIKETPDRLIITPRPSYRSGVLLDPHQDHRLAMAFAILGLRIGVRVRDIGCVAKSYPAFSADLQRLFK